MPFTTSQCVDYACSSGNTLVSIGFILLVAAVLGLVWLAKH